MDDQKPTADQAHLAPVITVDGPSGSGKGTVSALVAQRLGWRLLDSGALYRILAWQALEREIPLVEGDQLAYLVKQLDIEFVDDQIWVDQQDATTAIRQEKVSAGASQVAAQQAVRDALLTRQRAFRQFPGLVADGRDMGTVVFADAPLKIFLDASAEERARRRYNQLKNNELGVSLRGLLEAIRERDARDRKRAASPLRPAADAILIDSTDLNIDQVVVKVLLLAQQRGLKPGD